MKKTTQYVAYCLLPIAFCCSGLTGCSKPQEAATVEPSKVKVEEAPDVNIVEVDHPEQFPVSAVEVRSVEQALAVTGSVAPDVNRTVPVLSLSGGRAVDTRVRLGDDVQKGQLLMTIQSPDLSQAFSDYRKATADEALARRQLERAELLYGKGAYAEKDLEVARSAAEKAKVDMSTTADRIRILGADIAHPSPLLEVRAPIAGTVVEQNVTQGTGVRSLDNSPNLFTIADLSTVWVLCDVFENDLSKVHIGDSAKVQLHAYPDRVLQGRISNIGRVLDPTIRSAKIRIEMANPGMIMRPNMFVTATFLAKGANSRPVVPATAVLRLHDKEWVFVPLGGKRFRRTEIVAGPAGEGGVQEVKDGLKAGDKVVVNALQLTSAAEAQQ